MSCMQRQLFPEKNTKLGSRKYETNLNEAG
jgi:hypothetical protein